MYFGVVKGNRVELDLAEAERALMRDLLAAGLLDQAPADETAVEEPFEPVTVRGQSLSEQIISERR